MMMFARPGQQTFDPNIRVKIRPIDRRAADLKSTPLVGGRKRQRRIKCNRHANKTPVLQMKAEYFIVDDDIGNRGGQLHSCLLYTSPSPRDRQKSRMPSSA